MSSFLKGREFNRGFYERAVAPILLRRFPGLRYSAALLGSGSEVLGFDTEQSIDHDWGPRAQLFLREADCRKLRRPVLRALSTDLPETFGGLRTRFVKADSDGVRVRVEGGAAQGTPLVWVGTIREFFRSHLGVNPALRPSHLDWLLITSQKLSSLSAGPIFRDDLGLDSVRARFRYYPRDIWRHLIAVQWLRIAEEEAFVGRAAAVGDSLGSRLIAARQVRELMRLAFLLDRRYYPYDKWFGTAFTELPLAKTLRAPLEAALEARRPLARERALSRAYEILARRHNSLRISRPLEPRVSRFHERPYLVIHAGEFAAATRAQIRDFRIRELSKLGSVDQFGDTEELGSRATQLRHLRALLGS